MRPWLFVLVGTAILSAGTISPLYLTNGNAFQVVSGDNIVASWQQTPVTGLSIAVADTLRTNAVAAGVGREFTLNGTATGNTYATVVNELTMDGTTDGKFNYAVGRNSGKVYRFDRFWANPQTQFDLGGLGITSFDGIAWDAITNNLWTIEVAPANGRRVVQRDLSTGAEIGAFSLPNYLYAGLAIEPVDGTFWATNIEDVSVFDHFSRTGTYLGTLGPQGLVPGYGLEFALAEVPEPGSAVLAFMGIALTAGLKAWGRKR